MSVTVSAVDDAVDDDTTGGTIVHTVTSSDGDYDGIGVPDATFEIDDNDTAGMTASEETLTVAEGGAAASYIISLASEPTSEVTVEFAVGGRVNSTPNPLVIAPDDWATPQEIEVNAVDDDIASVAPTDTVMHSVRSADPLYQGFSLPDVAVSVSDNDQVGLVVSFEGGLTVTEGGGGDTLSVRLDSEPLSAVTVTFAPDSQVSVSPGTLVFDETDWDMPETADVSAVDDTDVEGDHNGTFSVTASSGDAQYDALAPQSLTVTITDDDTEETNDNANSNSNADGSAGESGGTSSGGPADDGGGCRSIPAPLAGWAALAILTRLRRRSSQTSPHCSRAGH